MKIDTDKDKIEEILSRSIAEILPSKEELRAALLSGKRLRIYIGADATGSQLHIGHATNFMILERLRQLGHETYVLFGDFTAMIGDPTDKNAARIRLTEKEVKENIKSWKDQISKVLNIKDKKNPAKIVQNSKWLSKLNFAQIIDISSNFTAQRMMERDMFEKRVSEEKPVYLHEFMYPLMQGYDSVVLNVDMEIGGTDQTFNMLAGRTLQKKYNNKEKFVLTTTLLVNPVTGKKLMSKSEGGFIALNDKPNDMFGKTMALADESIIQVFIDCTYLPISEIKEIEAKMKSGKINPRDAKIKLAKELVTIYHNTEEAERAEEYFVKTFSKRETPDEIEEVKGSRGEELGNILVEKKIIPSKSEFRRLAQSGAIDVNGEAMNDLHKKLEKEIVVKIGKKKFVKIII